LRIEHTGAVLVRPDGHVAFRQARTDGKEPDLDAPLRRVLARSRD
jgi:hypothetical protein